MRNFLLTISVLIFIAISASVVLAQDPAAIKPSVVTGDVVTATATAIELKTATGQITVELTEKTEFKRVPPENPKLSAAIAAQVSDIDTGDKLLVTGLFSNDRKRIPARAVYIMSKSDIARRHQEESQRWATRGISGKVASVDVDTKQISVEVRGLMGTTTVVINQKEDAIIKQYAPNSINFSEAIPATLANIEPWNMIRALGDRSPDGLSFAAEEIVTGAFQTIAGTVKSVNAETGEVVVTNLQTDADVTVIVGKASVLKRFPPEMAMRMAGGAAGQGGARPAGAQGQGGQRPAGTVAGQGTPQGRGGMGGGMNGARGGIDDMFERFPAITASELTVGDMIAVSSSKNGTNERITAIKLLAGVEPFIRAAEMAGQLQRGGRGRGASGGFTIPGLDGLDFP
ncbi:hypothetical protein BH24ACI3_BH24ACI3_08440 [soil metagenome]